MKNRLKSILIRWAEPLHDRLFRWMCRQGFILTCVDAPDTSGVNNAAQANADVAKEALDWFKSEASRTQGQRDQTVATQNAVAQSQLDAMRTQSDLAKDYADYNKGTFRPLEQRIVSDAQEFDTEGRREAAADAATADVRGATTRAMGASSRNLARMGYSPGGVNATKMAQTAALAEAGAATNARRYVEGQGRAMRMDAASLGRGLPSAQATAMQTGTAAGGMAANAAGAANGSAASAADLMSRGFNTSIAGNQSSGNLYAQSAELGSRSNLGGMMAGVGGLMQGAGYLFGSSKRIKHRGARMSNEEALEANNRLATDSWTYKAGVADEGTHVGPYAEDVQREFGDDAAPGGRMINMNVSAENNAKSIAALTKQLEDIEREIERMERAPVPPTGSARSARMHAQA